MRACHAALRPYFTVESASGIYETPAAYITDQPAFLNAALIGTTRLQPRELLQSLKRTETELGREPGLRYGPRLIDIDILFYGSRRISAPELTLPHPRLAEREFALRPLADVAATWQHPATGLTVAAMLAEVKEAKARRLADCFQVF